MLPRTNPPLQSPSRLWLAIFRRVARLRLRGNFRAVRITGQENLPENAPGQLIVCLNHPSWWDPLVCLFIASTLLPNRSHYAPISEKALQQYPIFAKLGMFPVAQNSLRGATQFLASARSALKTGVLWATPQGEFTDVRVRPAVFKPGLGALVHRLENVTILPIAIEYTFWNQRLPEVLIAFGEPIHGISGAAHSTEEWTAILQQRLELTQDRLASLALMREPGAFQTLLQGARGTAGVYGLWQRLRSSFKKEQYVADHVAAEKKR